MMNRVGALVAFITLLAIQAPMATCAEPPEGVLPLADNGKPLNFDFETGDLRDWKADGEAFLGQPVRGDTVAARRPDMKSQHQGRYWIGGYEIHGDRPQGTLTSVAFKVTYPWASFLVGGGPHETTRVELVSQDSGQVFYRASGLEEENLRRAVVDLAPYLGRKIFIRLVDRDSGHWGHVNFDDFRFHSRKPDFQPRIAEAVPPADVLPYAGLPPEKAAQVMTTRDGFEVKLFAGEPDVHQPIALCLDDRGRVWIAEAYSYPIRRPDKEARDRIVIFEDTDGDGRFDKRTIFMEGLNLVSGLEVGFGGVWIGAAPYLMYVPIKPGEDRPAGPPQILLDGWGYQDTHETLNTLSWGPDGWLYGCHGVFTHSRVGRPGTRDSERIPINAGVWRYHPTRHVFELFAEGTSNPWGLDFNDWGQAFCEACVIPHCFHVIQGARYQRQAGAHFNPYTFDDIKTIADHLHYQGATPWLGNDRSDSAGGGHAHCGTMIYLGGAWPDEYRNQMFMGNIHGRRINMDVLKPKGSGYVASHGRDFLLANDAWARFINLRDGPDGNAYLIDWYDKHACHTGNPDVWDRSNGRVYKISYRGTKPVQVDLTKLSDRELVKLQLNPNDWYVRHSRRLLQERGGSPAVREALAQVAFTNPDETRRLRGLWALHVTGGLTPERIVQGLSDPGQYVRAWTIQLVLESRKASPELLGRLLELARHDPSPIVRLYLASGLQRLPREQRWNILQGLLRHGEDVGDHNLPLMYWYVAEPLAGQDAARALTLAYDSRVPILAFMVQRLATGGSADAIKLIVDLLARADNGALQRAIVQGLRAGLQGRRHLAAPASWGAAFARLRRSGDQELRTQALSLAVMLGDRDAMTETRRLLTSANADLETRQNALAALVAANDPELAPVLQKLLRNRELREDAVRGLAAYDNPHTPSALLDVFPDLTLEERRDALNTLTSRASYARALLQAVADKRIAAAEIPAELVRQLRSLRSKELDRLVAEVWGIVRVTPAERIRMIADYRRVMSAPSATPPDRSLGRAIFAKTCAQCHALFGSGGKVGPELTGGNRGSLDYLLENILDPNAVIPKEYAATLIELKSGRVITGIVRSETPAALTIVTANETINVPRDEIESRTPSPTSMMPEDLLKPLSADDVRALIAYLQSPVQVPMLATAENCKELFNGKDLSGWDGDLQFWHVDNGEIVGRSPGLKRDQILSSQLLAGDFRLTLRVKLFPGTSHPGIGFRCQSPSVESANGYEIHLGDGWWGKLSGEGRGVVTKQESAPLKTGEWNECEIIARGGHIATSLNGNVCAEFDDPSGPRRGLFALVLHAGGPVEVRIKAVHLEVR
jgi:putative membrane-bound dehydrogenase-like protein